MKLLTAASMLFAALPLVACVKSQETMCTEAAKHTVRGGVLENAPLNSSKEMIEMRVEQLFNHPGIQQSIKECLDRKITKQEYECVMKSKTAREVGACGV